MINLVFHLPQFHKEVLNETIWGEGFTDWVTSQNAQRLYKGHLQPKIPEGGLYDLLDDGRTLLRQNELMKLAGFDGFCFYYYLFSENTNALRKPLEIIIEKKLPIEFCICWANHSWTRAWVGDDTTVIAEQQNDHQTIMQFVRDFSKIVTHEKYIRVDNKPVVNILNAKNINLTMLRDLCRRELDEDIFLVTPDLMADASSVDLFISWPPGDVGLRKSQSYGAIKAIMRKGLQNSFMFKGPLYKFASTVSEETFMNAQLKAQTSNPNISQTLLTGWDNTPRYGQRGYCIIPSATDSFVFRANEIVKNNYLNGHKITFTKAWNEWAEGNVIEPSKNATNYFLRMQNVLGTWRNF